MFPKKRLVPISTMFGRSFMEAVGSEIFGATWKVSDVKAEIDKDYPYSLGGSDTPELRKTFIQHQILSGLESGKLVAQVQLVDPAYDVLHYRLMTKDTQGKQRFSSLFADETTFIQAYRKTKADEEKEDCDASDELDEEADDDPEEDEEYDRNSLIWRFGSTLPTTFEPRVDSVFWQQCLDDPDQIDWWRSTINVSPKYLIFDKVGGYTLGKEAVLDASILGKESLFAAFAIRDAEAALAKIGVAHPEGVKGPGLRRYEQQDDGFWPEMIAVCWRVMAIQGLSGKRGDRNKLVAEMFKYLRHAGVYDGEKGNKDLVAPSESSLANLAGEITQQFEKKDCYSRVNSITGRYTRKLK